MTILRIGNLVAIYIAEEIKKTIKVIAIANKLERIM